MKIEDQVNRVVERLEATYDPANRRLGGRLAILRRTGESLGTARVAQAAASIAYYALFSLFPLLLFLVVVVSLFMDANQARQMVLQIAAEALPDSKDVQDLINSTVSAVFELRGEVGVISLLGLLWASSSAFTTLARNIDVAWAGKRPRPPLLQRVIGIAMILVWGILVLAVLFLSSAAGVLLSLDLPILEEFGIDSRLLEGIVSRGMTWLLPFVVFLALYRWVPSKPVPWRAALVAALMASIAWQIANAGFAWYLGSELARYELVYGSVTTIIVLMLWTYISMMIILVGAHLSASIAFYGGRQGDALDA